MTEQRCGNHENTHTARLTSYLACVGVLPLRDSAHAAPLEPLLRQIAATHTNGAGLIVNGGAYKAFTGSAREALSYGSTSRRTASRTDCLRTK